MNSRRGHPPPSKLTTAALLVLLAGCSVTPISPQKINATQIEHRPPPPQPVYTDMDHTLACLGDRLREQNIQPVLFGYSMVTDTTGKIGVDFAAVMRSALSKIASRGNNLANTGMGFGPTAKPEIPSVEERELQRDPARAARMVRPDWLITGGSVSVSSAFLSIQNSAGLSARDVDLSGSSTAMVDLISLSFAPKSAESGIDLPMRTVDVRVSHQVLSSAKEVGVFAQAHVNGQRYGAGLRLGRTVAVSQVAEDAVRVGIEWAAAQILATMYSVDLAACPQSTLTPDDQLPKAERLPTMSELPRIYRAMTPPQRLQWFRAALAARGYLRATPSGDKVDPATREALVRAAQDSGLPPNGQPTDALFYVLAARELAYGRDPRKAPPAEPGAPARIHVQLNQPNAPYVAGVYLRASVVPPQAGYMHCWLVGPDGAVSLYPILQGRSNFVTAGAAVLLPDNNVTGPHPRVRLTEPGSHDLWCGQARSNVTDRLPPELRAGGQSQATVSALREAYAKAAGADWLAEGSASFTVQPRVASR